MEAKLTSVLCVLGGEEPLPANVPALPLSGHGVLLGHVVLLRGAFQRHGQREGGAAQSAAGNTNSLSHVSSRVGTICIH